MSNPFTELSDKVEALQKRHDELVTAIPKLATNKKLAAEELAGLNKQVVDAQTKLDRLKEDITLQTDAYNKWQAGEMAKLDAAKVELSIDRKQLEDDTVAQDTFAKEQMAAIERAATDIEKGKIYVSQQKKEIADQIAVNTKWAERLEGKEKEYEGREVELKNMGDAAGARAQEMMVREQKVIEAERQAAETVQAAERDRKTARTLLDNAKEQISNVDAREQANELREKQLNGKERRLKLKEIELNDRANVLTGNGA